MSRAVAWASAKFGCVVAAWLAIGSASAFAASAVVMESSLAGLQRGQELTEDQQIDIPRGDHLLVAVVQNGSLRQVDIQGPRSGKVKDLLKPEPMSTRLWQLFQQLTRTGGASQGGVAASRGVWLTVNDVPLGGDVSVCVEEGSAPMITLVSGNSTSVRLSDNQGAQSATLRLSPGTGAAWPAAVPLKDGDVYRIIEQSNPQVELKLRLVPRGSLGQISSVGTLEVLATRGCEQQALAALRKVVARQ